MKTLSYKKGSSVFLALTLLVSLCVGFSVQARAAAAITAEVRGTYAQSDQTQEVTVRLNVSGVTEPYCGFAIGGGVELPEGFAIKQFSTSHTEWPMNASHFNKANGKVTYSSGDMEDTIPADTYYEIVFTAPANAAGEYTVRIKSVSVLNRYARNELARAGEILVNVTIGPIHTHTYDNGADTTCNDCGYVRAVGGGASGVGGSGSAGGGGGFGGGAATYANPFTDVVRSDYYYDAVLWAAERGITSGTSATTFGPNETCTRAQTMTFLWRVAGSPKPTTATCPFEDVTPDKYYYDAVLWAVENGITAGTSATTFSPDATVTRAQNVTFLWRVAGAPAAEQANVFGDVATGQYYHDAVLWAAQRGITAGTSATTFGPDDPCLRSQIVTFLYRFAQK